MMSRALIVLFVLTACKSKQTVEDAQCSDEERGLFMACLSSGCSASCVSGTDACAVEGGEGCGFNYVVCNCPEGQFVPVWWGVPYECPRCGL